MGLRSVSQAMTTELSSGRSETGEIEPAKNSFTWDASLTYGFLMLLIGLAVIFVGSAVLHEQLMADIGTVISFLGVGILGYRGLQLLMSKCGTKPIKPIESIGLPKSESTVQLPSADNFEGIPSVTEPTTRNLEPTPVERKAD